MRARHEREADQFAAVSAAARRIAAYTNSSSGGYALTSAATSTASPVPFKHTSVVGTASSGSRNSYGGSYDKNYRFDMRLVSTVGLEVTKRGAVAFVLLEAPVRPSALEEVYGADGFAAHTENMRAFAEEHGFLYWNLNQEAGLTDSDYYDYTHLWVAEARERYTRVLGGKVASLIEERLP